MQRILELLQKSGKQMSDNYRGQREIMDKQVAMHQQMLGAMTQMWVEWMEKGKRDLSGPFRGKAVLEIASKKNRDNTPREQSPAV